MKAKRFIGLTLGAAMAAGVGLHAGAAKAQAGNCGDLPAAGDLSGALAAVNLGDVGLGFDMWATVVDTHGIVCAVVHSGASATGDQWLGSRVISAQKANTANLFSRTDLALSTANLWAATQPGGSLFGLQFSNPVDPAVAYGDNAGAADSQGADTANTPAYGSTMGDDPMVGELIGGVNVFGGGLGLYDADGNLVGGLGMSGDTSCADHVKAWRVRHELNLDNVPGGVSPTGDDNIIFDITGNHSNFASKSGFGHPVCGLNPNTVPAAEALPNTHPIGPDA